MDIDEIRRQNICLLEKEAGSATAMAAKVKMTLTQYINLRDGAKDSATGKRRGMRKDTAWKFDDAGNRPRGWLDADHGIALSSNTLVALRGVTSLSSTSNAEQAPALGADVRVPVVGTAQLGDNGFWAEIEYPAGHGDGFIPFATRDESAYALRCRGDSMKPRIKNGEFVIVEPSYVVQPGDEVLVKAKDGRVLVKEYLYTRDDAVHLGSVNEAHGKLVIPIENIERMHYVSAVVKAPKWRQD